MKINQVDARPVAELVLNMMRRNQIIIDVLRAYPCYTSDVDVLSQKPSLVSQFVRERKLVGDQTIEEVLGMANVLTNALWQDSNLLHSVESEGASVIDAVGDQIIKTNGKDIEQIVKSDTNVIAKAFSAVTRGMENAKQKIHLFFSLPLSMAGGMNLAPSFSTTDTEHNTPEHCLRQSTPIGEEGSAETLEVVCESYANHPHAVDLKMAVVNPKTLMTGARVGITLGNGGEDAPRVEVVLADDRKGGLYGLGEFAMPWDKFVSYGTKDALTIDIDLPPRD